MRGWGCRTGGGSSAAASGSSGSGRPSRRPAWVRRAGAGAGWSSKVAFSCRSMNGQRCEVQKVRRVAVPPPTYPVTQAATPLHAALVAPLSGQARC